MATAWTGAFADAYAPGATPVEQQVYAAVLGEEHPAELDTYSCLTRAELDRMVAWLAGPEPDLLVDIGCGRGGPGIAAASACAARLVGLDVTAVPLDAAAIRADESGVDAEFRVASFAATGLPDGTADAVLSVDVLQFVDAAPAFAEVARILRPGGRLALTAAEHVDDLDAAVQQQPRTAALARAAGLEVVVCDSPPGWPATARRIATAMVEAADDIAAATGATPHEVRAALEAMATHRTQERRILLLASRAD